MSVRGMVGNEIEDDLEGAVVSVPHMVGPSKASGGVTGNGLFLTGII